MPADAPPDAVALVAAAGRGERLGPGAPKALRALAGEPLLVHAVRGLLAASSVAAVVVAGPPDDLDGVRALLDPLGGPVRVVPGGPERPASVALALRAAPPEYDVVLVHDAARPLTPAALVDAVAAAVRAGAGAVVPALPVADTVKRVDAAGRVLATLDRSELVTVQTPQGFRRAVLERAHAEGPAAATDDAGMVEALGGEVVTVLGSPLALKVTRPEDLLLAEALLAARAAGERA